MYSILSNDGQLVHGVKEYVCDTVEELKDLPPCKMGSTCFVVSEQSAYMMGGNGEWVKL